MSSTGENGDTIPGKQNEEKTYKKVSVSLSSAVCQVVVSPLLPPKPLLLLPLAALPN